MGKQLNELVLMLIEYNWCFLNDDPVAHLLNCPEIEDASIF